MKVLVCQRGARHRYAIPRMLEEAGMLAGLYTDSYAYSPLGKLAAVAEKVGVKCEGVHSLAARCPLGVPRSKVFSSDLLAYTVLNVFKKDPFAYADILAPVYEKWGTQGADIVYTMNTADLPFLKHAKSKGLKIIADIFVSPKTEQIMEDEMRREFPGKLVGNTRQGAMRERYLSTFALADIILCPSEWVADGCREMAPEHAHKIRICPYGSSIEVLDTPSVTSSNKVLFAGRDVLRKGLHYFADAAEQMLKNGLDAEFIVAGAGNESCGWMKNADSLSFLGHVPMGKMKQLFRGSAVFVLPSLSEGQAGVVLEALAMGCPVVVTRECGVDIEDGKQGFVVPARDSNAIAMRVSQILKDPELQLQMSPNALEFAQQFSMSAWADRLKKICEKTVS